MLVELVTVEAAYRVANNVAHRMTNKRAELPPFFVGAKFVTICLSIQSPALRPK